VLNIKLLVYKGAKLFKKDKSVKERSCKAIKIAKIKPKSPILLNKTAFIAL
jgi:hypothetical protein